MKAWFKAELEKGFDNDGKCSVCGKAIKAPDFCFAQAQYFQGNMPNLNELHLEPTGKRMCLKCGEKRLV